MSGTPIPVAERIGNVGSFAFFSVASNVLAYRTGTATSSNLSQLFWVGRKGELLGNVGEPRQLSSSPFSVSMAPNGRQAALMVTASAIPSPDIWTIEFARGIATRVTFDAAADSAPIWSPDSTRITFRSNRGSAGNIYETDLAGTTKEKVLIESPEADAPTDWSFDGRFLLFNRFKNTVDLWVLSAKAQPPAPVPLLETPFAEQDGRFSPDGRWIAYTSNESGEEEIYLRPFAVGSNGAPAVGPKWRVSTAGGASARWRRDGKELFYLDRSGAIVAVDVVDKGTSIETGAPRPLFTPSLGMNSFDVHPDGQRFLLSGLLSFQAASPDPVTVVLNWTTVRSAQ